jgi:hypothetical protein
MMEERKEGRRWYLYSRRGGIVALVAQAAGG